MAKFCQKCGKKLPLFASGVLCRDCEISYKAELARIEAEGSDVTETAAGAPLVPRAMCLSRILDYIEPMTPGYRRDRIHVRCLPCQMDGHDCLGSAGDRILDLSRVDVVGI